MTDTDLIKQLENTGKYKVIKRLEPQGIYNNDDGGEKKIAIFLDIESTGTNIDLHEIIELAMVKFEYNSDDGKIYRIIEEFSEFQEPQKEITAKITELTGITNDMVKGKKISADNVQAFIKDIPLILAHNASFDRQMSEKYFSFFSEKSWGCSIADVDWEKNGYFKQSLELLAYKYGFFFDGHRATNDCLASIHLLTKELQKSECFVLNNLLFNARKKLYRINALGKTYDAKDDLKERGYKWNGKFWHIDLDKDLVESECGWLKDNYGFHSKVAYVDSFNRHSNRV